MDIPQADAVYVFLQGDQDDSHVLFFGGMMSHCREIAFRLFRECTFAKLAATAFMLEILAEIWAEVKLNRCVVLPRDGTGIRAH